MGVLLRVEMVHIQVPQSQVTICGAGDEQLTAGSERAGNYTGVSHCTSPKHHHTQVSIKQFGLGQCKINILSIPSYKKIGLLHYNTVDI